MIADILCSPLLSHVRHGFFARTGGVSTGIYASLNVAYGSADERGAVQHNRDAIAQGYFQAAPLQLLTLKQIHSDCCLVVDAPYDPHDAPEADALVTNQAGLILGVLSADCVPILLHDPEAAVIGAAHAGWKGAWAGIVQSTIKAMCTLGAHPARICAATGPSIAQPSYEVDTMFREVFLEQDASHARFFVPSPASEAHYLFDNKAYVAQQLLLCGLLFEHIHTLPHDTYADEARYFSFRRATHHKEDDYGRQLSAIML
ncbi:MAG: peptidoglycan editing factor PgeF [Alphaproteobacteria bacterium]|nr:MAG: peptidoglycan editing factor PgeF [Alphaproteobacteria bacterium]